MTEETKEAIIYKPGMIVKIHQKIKEMNTKGVGVEKIYPIHSPVVDKIEVVRQLVVRRAKLGFLRNKDFKRKMKDTKKEVKKEVKK